MELSMTASVLRSFEADEGVAHVLLVKNFTEVALHVRGSDRVTIARLPQGEPIQFEVVHDGQGVAVRSTYPLSCPRRPDRLARRDMA